MYSPSIRKAAGELVFALIKYLTRSRNRTLAGAATISCMYTVAKNNSVIITVVHAGSNYKALRNWTGRIGATVPPRTA